MDEQQIRLKLVYELRADDTGGPTRYHIPAYQRGYCWTPQQVAPLLDDIRVFTQRDNGHHMSGSRTRLTK